MAAYYNEIDPGAAAWLRELIAAGHIAPGVVDERSIEDVSPDDLLEFDQCHFFAGIGVWSYALRQAGWPDDRRVWTGSCPCQPFSAAGAGAGFDDERHLWPTFHWLIAQCRPAVVFGEQVASKAVDTWIDLVHVDLEAVGYAFGSIPFPSAGVGAPHIRDRNYWAGVLANDEGLEGRRGTKKRSIERAAGAGLLAHGLADANKHGRGALAGAGIHHAEHHAEPCGGAERLGNSDSIGTGRDGGGVRGTEAGKSGRGCGDDVGAPSAAAGGLADPASKGRRSERTYSNAGNIHEAHSAGPAQSGRNGADHAAGPTNGFWRDADWLGCRDGKWRPVEPGTFPLANGAAARVVRLRGYCNAINAKAAQAFIEASEEAFADLGI